MNNIRRYLLRTIPLGLVLGACDPAVTNEPPLVTVAVVSGDAQSASVGEPLPQPLVVRALGQDGSPLPGARIIFSLPDSFGIVVPEQEVTGMDGMISAAWTLGPKPGPMEVSVAPESGGVPITISAEATALPVASLSFNTDTLRLVRPVEFQIVVTARNKLGQVVPDPAIAWTTTKPEVATVSGSGLVQSVGPGVAHIRAQAGDVVRTIYVEVAVN